MCKPQEFTVSLLKKMSDTNPENVSLEVIYQLLILDTLRTDTEKHRYYKSVGLLKEAQSIKNRMYNFTPSVILLGGKQEKHIQSYTGLGLSDFDHVPPDELEHCLTLLDADPYVALAYITISGEGIRVIYRTEVMDRKYHTDVFRQGNEYYAHLLGHDYDPQCKNIARTSILCYCPNAIFHPNVQAMPITLSPTQEKRVKGVKNIYHAKLSEAEEIIIRKLKEEGKSYSEGHYNEYVSAAFYLMNRYGVDKEEVRMWAVNRFSDYSPSQLESMICCIYQHTEEYGTIKIPKRKSSEHSYASLTEIEAFITSQAKVRNNTITEQREIWMNGESCFREITDRDENTLWARANKNNCCTGPQTIQMILNSEYVPNFNPFIDYFEKCPSWDGVTDYIRQLTDTVHAEDQELFHIYFKKWFVALVASLLDPKVVNHEALIFISDQGYYKTTWMNRLLPPELSRYFYTKTNSRQMTKDDLLTLVEFALICFEEIDHMRPAEMDQFKAMVTMPTVNERAAYARNKSHRPHIASICGTGNNIHFLNDPTGNRRWLPFVIISIDDPYSTTLNYDGIYAQALYLYHSGFQYWFDQEEIKQLNRHNENFEVPNLESELVQMYYRKPMPGEHGIFVSTAEIMQRISALIKTPLSITNIGITMRKLGFENCRCRNIRGFRVVELTQQEINEGKQTFDQPTTGQLPF